jgi:hypothetical protein
MAETTADVRRDIELTRERMSTTLAQIEQKMNLMQVVRDHPWPAIAVAVGAGVLLSGSSADVKAAGATVAATRGAGSKIGTVLDDVVANLMTGVSQAFQSRVDGFVNELKVALGAPVAGPISNDRNTSSRDQASSAGGWSGTTADRPSQGLGGESRSGQMTSSSTHGGTGAGRGDGASGSNLGSQQWQPGV